MTSKAHRADRPKSSEAGISFLELVVSLFVMALVLPALAYVQTSSVKLTVDASNRDAAWTAARAKAEELRSLDISEVVPGADDYVLADGTVMARSWTVWPDKPNKGSLTISVSVETDALQGSRKPVRLSVVKAK